MELDFTFDLPVTKEDILNHASEEDIFCYYMGLHVIPNSLVLSPIREDKHPTCSFFKGRTGVLYLKDFATGDCLNCFSLVQRMYNCTYHKAIDIIASDLGIRGSIKAERSINLTKTSKFKNKQPSSIQIEAQPFTAYDIKWWSQFNITPKLLQKYNVYSCKYVFLDECVFAKSSDKCPIYAYYFGKKNDKEIFKIYMPKRKKERKWISNVSSDIIQGIRQIPHKGELLVITKSLKDCICLRSIGIPAIAPNSEVLFLSDDQLARLKNRFNKIVVLYDRDKTGMHRMYEIRKNHPDLLYALMPKETESKDFTDYVAKVGIEKAKELVKEYLEWIKQKT